ncbi:MAG: hypothetical protein M1832_003814 [Thelocarpon impressellum]|nr:MAG: hypothetical protein M1832_003814 [Thelocarpon impressellum]
MSGKPPIDGYIDPNFPNPNTENDAPIIIYGYTPSFVLAVLGVAIFALSTLVHLFQVVKYRTWYFIPIVVGSAMEVVGYAFRCLSAKVSPYNIIYFVVQYFFIVVAPVMFSAAIYTVLSILINAVGRQYSPIRPRLILILFIVSDVVATGVQVAGAALIGKAESDRKDPTTANNILLAGLAFQVFTFFVFLALLFVFFWRSRKVSNGPAMKPFTFALCAATLLVYLRTCFRLAETAQGLGESLSSREVFFGCLEFAPIVLALLVFNIWHPGKWVPRYSYP